MISCYSCAKSYTVPVDTCRSCGYVLMCKPDGKREQAADVPCLKYQCETVVDEPSEVE